MEMLWGQLWKGFQGILVLFFLVGAGRTLGATWNDPEVALVKPEQALRSEDLSKHKTDDVLLAKFPIDLVGADGAVYPYIPIRLASSLVSCDLLSGVNPLLSRTVRNLAAAHYLDDLSAVAADLKRFHLAGEPRASLLYASFVDEGLVFPQNDALAISIYEETLQSDDPFAIANAAGHLYELDQSNEEQNKNLLGALELALRKFPESVFLKHWIAYLIAKADGIYLDETRVIKLWAEAYETCPDDSALAYWYGDSLLKWGPGDAERSLGLGLVASVDRSTDAAVAFSRAIEYREEGEGDKALELATLASDLGSPVAGLFAADMLRETDAALSMKFLKRAAHLGDSDAIESYAGLLLDGAPGVPADPQASLVYFQALQSVTGNWKPYVNALEIVGDADSLQQAKSFYAVVLRADESTEEEKFQAETGLDRVSRKLEYFSQPQEPLRVVATREEASPINAGRFKALIVGNGRYLSLPSLNTPVSDARKVANLLEEKYGFETTLLLDGSRSDLLNALNQMRKTLGERDNFLLFYAGHGVYDEEVDEGYWQPVDSSDSNDAQWVSNSRITTTLRGFKSRNVLVVADSCYSGVLLRGSGREDSEAASGLDRREYLQRLLEKKTRVALTSGGVEPVVDGLAGEDGSVFTSAFLRVLEGSEGALSGQEIFLKVSEEVVRVSAAAGITQTPEFAGILQSGHDGGDFIFVPR